MSLEIFLLAMQAAGAIGDIIGTDAQARTLKKGAEVEQANIQTRLNEEQLGAALSAVDSMKALRQTLATQRAIFAAKGTNPGAGSASIVAASSVHEAGVDERIRRMNLLSREAALRANSTLAGLHALAGETQLGQQLSQRLFKQIPFSELDKAVGENRTTDKKPTSSIGSVNKGK